MNIKQIKEKYTCIDYLGEPVRKVANGYLYRCPWRTDAHPSLSVTLDGKGWHDLSDGTHGNLIDLVSRCIDSDDFRQICAALSTFSFPTVKNNRLTDLTDERKKDSFESFGIYRLRQWQLVKYLNHRGIDVELAQRYGVAEAHYTTAAKTDGYYFALAYPNDKGGCELRNSRFKGSKAPKGITTHLFVDNAPVAVFEGFIDMLSYATMMQAQGKAQHNYVVLNSIINVDAAIEVIRANRGMFRRILLALDNDNGGTQATDRFIAALPDAEDIRGRFAPCKDINDYLMNHHGEEKPTQDAGHRMERWCREGDGRTLAEQEQREEVSASGHSWKRR